MLARKNRILEERDFKKAFREKGVKNNFFSLKSKPNRLNTVRIGIIVSKKISPKSTERNKLKRRIREVFKALLPKISKNTDIVLNAFPRSLELNFQEIKKNIIELLKKVRLLND